MRELVGARCSSIENINLILAFIINIISQPIEHLNISSAFIVYSNTFVNANIVDTLDVSCRLNVGSSFLVNQPCVDI